MTAAPLRPPALPWGWNVVRLERAGDFDSPAWECEVSDGQIRLIVQSEDGFEAAANRAAREAFALVNGPEWHG